MPSTKSYLAVSSCLLEVSPESLRISKYLWWKQQRSWIHYLGKSRWCSRRAEQLHVIIVHLFEDRIRRPPNVDSEDYFDSSGEFEDSSDDIVSIDPDLVTSSGDSEDFSGGSVSIGPDSVGSSGEAIFVPKASQSETESPTPVSTSAAGAQEV